MGHILTFILILAHTAVHGMLPITVNQGFTREVILPFGGKSDPRRDYKSTAQCDEMCQRVPVIPKQPQIGR